MLFILQLLKDKYCPQPVIAIVGFVGLENFFSPLQLTDLNHLDVSEFCFTFRIIIEIWFHR